MSQLVDRHGQPLELVLYKRDTCRYCVLVADEMDRLGLTGTLRTRDTRFDPGALDELIRLGGMRQVPMLLVNGKPMYESGDIIAFLRDEVRGRS